MRPLLSLLIPLAAVLVTPIPTDPPPTPDPKLIFILAGQSNMAGRGGVYNGAWDCVVPLECRPSPSVLRLSADLQWETAHEPLHADIDVHKTCGVGPGMAFANSLLLSTHLPAAVLGLVPCAIGGTNISEWEKGMPLYEAMVRRSEAAVANETGTLAAVLWYQGESDTVYREDADGYRMRLERMILDLRTDLGSPGLLVIQVALASGEGPYVETVRKAQKGIKLPNVTYVDAKGLPLEEDHLHLTSQAQVQLGKKLAAAYISHSRPT